MHEFTPFFHIYNLILHWWAACNTASVKCKNTSNFECIFLSLLLCSLAEICFLQCGLNLFNCVLCGSAEVAEQTLADLVDWPVHTYVLWSGVPNLTYINGPLKNKMSSLRNIRQNSEVCCIFFWSVSYEVRCIQCVMNCDDRDHFIRIPSTATNEFLLNVVAKILFILWDQRDIIELNPPLK